jgi:hypothetical protein
MVLQTGPLDARRLKRRGLAQERAFAIIKVYLKVQNLKTPNFPTNTYLSAKSNSRITF